MAEHRRSRTPQPAKYKGTLNWVPISQGQEAAVRRAIVRGKNQVVMDFVAGGTPYSVDLRSTNGVDFTGQFSAKAQGRVVQGRITARFVAWGDSALLIGEWTEDDEDYQWWVDLERVDRFLDEDEQTPK